MSIAKYEIFQKYITILFYNKLQPNRVTEWFMNTKYHITPTKNGKYPEMHNAPPFLRNQEE